MIKYQKPLIILFLIIILLLITLQFAVFFYPHFAIPRKSDSIVILGYALKDGLTPDNWLELRLKKGMELYNRGYSKTIIVSGGQGKKDKIPVSISMKRWLITNGIPESDIITEESSHSTDENFKYTQILCKKTILIQSL